MLSEIEIDNNKQKTFIYIIHLPDDVVGASVDGAEVVVAGGGGGSVMQPWPLLTIRERPSTRSGGLTLMTLMTLMTLSLSGD